MIELLRSRRSIRVFKNTPIPDDALELLKESLLRSPSSRGKNPWEFIFVKNPATLKDLSHAKEHGGEFLEQAPLGIVICGNETVSDVWIEDCSIAAIIVQLAAHTLGLGSCWVQIRNRNNKSGQSAEQFIQNLLSIPAHLRVLAVIGIGIPAETKHGVSSKLLSYNKIHSEMYK